jgi:hypothetical protein
MSPWFDGEWNFTSSSIPVPSGVCISQPASVRRDDAADGGALAGAVGADLVLLELAIGIEGEDADGVPVGDTGILQRHCCGVGGDLIWEDSEYELPVGHRSVPSVGCGGA